MAKITAVVNNTLKVEFNVVHFPAGEVQVNVQNPTVLRNISHIRIIIKAMSSMDDFMVIRQLVGIARQYNSRASIELFFGYFPYARQDRNMVKGDSFALRIFASMVNNLKADSVVICDPHSDVTPALVDNCRTITQSSLFMQSEVVDRIRNNPKHAVISPDAGAMKKIYNVMRDCGLSNNPLIHMMKHRDVSTGTITHSSIVNVADLHGVEEVTIIDDICDGGATFIAAAEQLKAYNVKRVNLFVTHGVFSRGTKHLTDHGIDAIYTTSTYFDADGEEKVNHCVEINAWN